MEGVSAVDGAADEWCLLETVGSCEGTDFVLIGEFVGATGLGVGGSFVRDAGDWVGNSVGDNG